MDRTHASGACDSGSNPDRCTTFEHAKQLLKIFAWSNCTKWKYSPNLPYATIAIQTDLKVLNPNGNCMCVEMIICQKRREAFAA